MIKTSTKNQNACDWLETRIKQKAKKLWEGGKDHVKGVSLTKKKEENIANYCIGTYSTQTIWKA